MTAEHIRIESQICEGQKDLKGRNAGREVRVTVLRGGASLNGFYYGEETLQAICNLIENAQAYVDHAEMESSPVRSVRDIVGFYRDPQYVPPDAETPLGRVDATLHLLPPADWLWSLICESCEMGLPDLIGLSIDIYGSWRPLTSTSTTSSSSAPNPEDLKEVFQVHSLNSCDIVTRPSAGGTFRHILHAYKGDSPMFPEDTSPDAALASTSANSADEHSLSEAQTEILEQLRVERSQLLLERRLLEAPLPNTLKNQMRTRYQGRAFEAQELERDLQDARQLLGDLIAAGLVRDHSYEKPEISAQVTEAEKMQAAFDRMFDLDIDSSRLGNVRGFSSIREAYSRVTGDPGVSGFSERSQLGAIHVSELAPITRISEADTTTASFSFLLGTSMNKRLLKDYQAWPSEWSKFVNVTPIRDFKQQTRVRLGAFGSLSTVAEDTPYTTMTLTDTAATYVPAKRGNLVSISRETIVNDDLQAIKQIPTKLAVAAAYTLAEFVYSFLSSNPTIYDSSALFTASAPHNNLGAAALASTSLQNGVTAMREQSNFAGKRIGLRPRFLVVPPELEWASMVLTHSAGVPGSPNNDINPMLGYVTPIVSPQLTSTTQWFLIADPREVDTIEIGFVGGQINPALFIQDQPLYGLNFTQDVLTYKIRHEYGGAVVDYRGLYRGI